MSRHPAWWLAAKLVFSCEVALIACSPVPRVTPTGGSCETMCASFQHAGCPAGSPSGRFSITCEDRCEAQLRTMATRPPIACVTAAHGELAAIEACGERCTK